MDKINQSCDEFNSITTDPLSFLTGNENKSFLFTKLSSVLYTIGKQHRRLENDDPFAALQLDEFDDEQLWQQIDVLNGQSINTCSKGAALCLNTKVKLHSDEHISAEEVASEEEEQEAEDVEDDDQHSDSDHEELKDSNQPEVFEKTKVDDDFFSLRQMEKFLLSQESEQQKKANSDEEIDYFDEIPSDNDIDEDELDQSLDGEFESDGFQNFDVESDEENFDLEETSLKTKSSARDLTYDQFFPDVVNKTDTNKTDTKELSKFEKQQRTLSKRIKTLEEQALGEKDWQMQGESLAYNRPVNSLLEEVLSFSHSQRPAPEITDEHTCDLEKIICQRIKDKSWDDVERKIKEIKDPHEYKKNITLDSEKSKMSLQEIYEKEYLAKLSQEKEEKSEDPAQTELSSLMNKLFKKLDALSNFHFRLPPPEPEIKVLSNLPSVAMEEVQPVTHTDSNVLAPEEVHNKQEVKGDLEKSSTDRKRERRKKAVVQKVRAKARLRKLEKLADTNDKLKTLKAVKQLQQAAKHAAGQTTIIQSSASKKKRQMSSKTFFDKLKTSAISRKVS